MKLTIFHMANPFLTIKPSYNGLSATCKGLVHYDRSLRCLDGPMFNYLKCLESLQISLHLYIYYI